MATLVKGIGPTPCPGMIVGEAPGADEDKSGLPFQGKSGSILEEALAVCGIDREEVFITNVYKYRPPGNRKPDKKELASHSMMLHKEIGDCRPKIILLLGAVAAGQFITLSKGIMIHRGKIRTVGDMCILPTIHPSYVLRSRTVRFEMFLEDVKLFARISGLGKE